MTDTFLTTPSRSLATEDQHSGDFKTRIRKALAGDQVAAGKLWSAQAPRLLRAALALGVPQDQAQDQVQETLLAAFRALSSYDPERGTFTTWTHAILVRRCSNWRRSRARLVAFLGRLRREERSHPAVPASGALEAGQLLEKLLRGLPSTQRRVWALVEGAGLTAAESARVLGLQVSTVRSNLRHARQNLSLAARKEKRES